MPLYIASTVNVARITVIATARGARRGHQGPREPRRGQDGPGLARTGQENPGGPGRTQETPGWATRGQERLGAASSGREEPGGASRGQEGPLISDLAVPAPFCDKVVSNTRKHKNDQNFVKKQKSTNKTQNVPELVITLGFGFGAPDFESTSKVLRKYFEG